LEEKTMKRLFAIMSLLMVASMVLAACAPAATATEAPPAPTEAPTAAPTEAPTEAPTAAPTEPPTTRKGGWLDEIAFSVITSDSAVTQLAADAVDIYAGGLAAAEFPSIEDAGLSHSTSNGLYYDELYNPAVCADTAVLNPFSSRKIREATNWLYDRNYINQEVYAGGALAKWFVIQTNGPDYADLADVARSLEAKYAYDPDHAKEVITTEMEAMGATLNADGKWEYNGAPVTLAHIIRTDSDGTRVPIGDYVSAQLESVGFTVDRQYKKSSEASPIWIGSEPTECQWQVYTAAWSSTQIDRDERDMFQQMYPPSSVQGMSVFIANEADPAFRQAGDDLATGNYTSLAQRRDLMVQAMSLAMEDSVQVWLIDGKNFTPYQTDVQVSSDLAAGVEGANIYPFTLRFIGQEGGVMRWAEPDLFGQAWNPVAGSNWAFDQAAIRATSSGFNGLIPDPYTGLYWPLRFESGEVTVLDSLPPLNKSLDWVTLNTAPEIQVPADAWVDWDAATQTFIPAGEGKTAKLKSVVHYPADLWTTVKWHDGSNISPADFVMAIIMLFDRAKTESAIYDEAAVPNFESFMSGFRGVKIVSTDPLVINGALGLGAIE
jgi:peptide/nickel transport system substrate-binding protein